MVLTQACPPANLSRWETSAAASGAIPRPADMFCRAQDVSRCKPGGNKAFVQVHRLAAELRCYVNTLGSEQTEEHRKVYDLYWDLCVQMQRQTHALDALYTGLGAPLAVPIFADIGESLTATLVAHTARQMTTIMAARVAAQGTFVGADKLLRWHRWAQQTFLLAPDPQLRQLGKQERNGFRQMLLERKHVPSKSFSQPCAAAVLQHARKLLQRAAPARAYLEKAKPRTSTLHTPAGDFVITNTLTKGVYGKVRFGMSCKDGALVAVKEQRLQRAAWMGHIEPLSKKTLYSRREGYERELQLLRQLRSATDPKVVVEIEEKCFWVMPLLGGQVCDLVRCEPVASDLRCQAAILLLVDLVPQLVSLHALRHVHCDLRPENILNDTQGKLLLTDFGLATPHKVGQTAPILGTFEYLPPETLGSFFNEHKLGIGDTQVDIWSLGATACALLTGALPFASEGGRRGRANLSHSQRNAAASADVADFLNTKRACSRIDMRPDWERWAHEPSDLAKGLVALHRMAPRVAELLLTHVLVEDPRVRTRASTLRVLLRAAMSADKLRLPLRSWRRTLLANSPHHVRDPAIRALAEAHRALCH